MLTFTGSEENHNSCFRLLGTVKPSSEHVNLISDNTSLIISTALSEGGMDTCSFYSGPNDSTIMSFAEKAESCGSIAYASGESCGSIAYSGSETSGSIASSSGGFSSGGSCSYSC